MKRHRRTRRIHRRGVRHVGDLLAILVNEIEQNDTAESAPVAVPAAMVPGTSGAANAVHGIGQSTFSFYQTAGG